MRAKTTRAPWRLALIGLIAVSASAPLAHAQIFYPAAPYPAQVYRGNDTGGIIPWSCENEADARKIAGAYCSRWGKYARITSVHRMYGDYIGFNCLWRPGIARFQIPAVGTSRVCRGHARARRLHPRVQVRY
jgi:hypothetical protein